MARKIIILERTNNSNDQNFRIAFWMDVPAARQQFYANANAVSQVIGATAGELAAIRSGAVVEEVVEVPALAGVARNTVLAAIVTKYNARQAEITAYNPWVWYGSSWDGTTWTGVTVA